MTELKEYVIVDLSDVSEIADDEVTVPIVSDRYDDPHKAKAELKKRQNSIYRSSRNLKVVSILKCENND